MRWKSIIKWLLPVVFLVFLFIRADWVINGWRHSPLDKSGPLYLGAAVVLAFLGLKSASKLPREIDVSGIFLLAAGILGVLLGIRGDINSLYFLGTLSGLFGCLWCFLGWRVFLWSLPIFGLCILSLPTTTYLIDIGMVTVFQRSFGRPETMKALLGIFLAIIFIPICVQARSDKPWIRRSTALYMAAVVIVCLLFIGRFTKPVFSDVCRPELKVLKIGSWSGTQIDLTPAEQGFFRGCDVEKLVFFSPDGYAVASMVIEAESDIHLLHPPEYCLASSGWHIEERSRTSIELGNESVPAMRIAARRGRQEIVGVYWFSSRKFSTPSHAAFRKNAEAGEGGFLCLFTCPVMDKREVALGKIRQFLKYLHCGNQT